MDFWALLQLVLDDLKAAGFRRVAVDRLRHDGSGIEVMHHYSGGQVNLFYGPKGALNSVMLWDVRRAVPTVAEVTAPILALIKVPANT